MFLGIDLGTSAIKLLVVSDSSSVLAESNISFDVRRPHPLWSEQDPDEWWSALLKGIEDLKSQTSFLDLKGIGLSGQMHGAVLLDKKGEVLRPAILWNDGRSGKECLELEDAVPDLHQITGNQAMPGFTAPKLLWICKNEPKIFNKIRTVLLPKDFLRFRLCGEAISDMSDSSGTLWMDTAARDWSEKILNATSLSRDQMPRLVEGTSPGGVLHSELAREWGIKTKTIIAGGGGDNAAGAIGVGAIKSGSAFISLGTSGVYFVVNSLFTHNAREGAHAFCHCIPDTWHQMGVILSASSCLSWLSGIMKQSESELISGLESSPHQPGELIFLPYLSGERTPHNNPNAQGVFFGLTHQHGAKELTKAVLEGVAYAFSDSQKVLLDAGAKIEEVSLIGGGSKSHLWAQILASVLERPIIRHVSSEIGPALGAARLAMLATDNGTIEEICQRPLIKEIVEPYSKHVPQYRNYSNRFRRLYKILEEDFS
ncbi:MAG: xylulokinase [Candidatus Marinimicrobia bacterium]|nr:xylulokinase [Candidatus Neomarinimicrobiota bacterium]